MLLTAGSPPIILHRLATPTSPALQAHGQRPHLTLTARSYQCALFVKT